MKINLPVSQQEFAFPKGQTLVSITDPKGRITYCNTAFVSVSGFSKEELLGQAHNLVRHPDMPEEAFRDMWDTIQKALPWTGLVKNRRRNGDYYWVRANVTPMLNGPKVVGYMSVDQNLHEKKYRLHPSFTRLCHLPQRLVAQIGV